MAKGWNEVVWNEVVMERSGRNSTLFTSEQPKRNKIDFPFCHGHLREKYFDKQGSCYKKNENGNKVWFDSIKWYVPTSFSKAKNQSYHKLSSTIKVKDETSSVLKHNNIVSRRGKAAIEGMTPGQLNKCLQNCYLSVGKRDSNFCNKKSLTKMNIAR